VGKQEGTGATIRNAAMGHRSIRAERMVASDKLVTDCYRRADLDVIGLSYFVEHKQAMDFAAVSNYLLH
jgi:hypothetical protein